MRFDYNKIWKNFTGATIIKVSFYNAVSVIFKVLFSYISNKAIVIYLGPVGTALTEQMRNFVQAVQGIATMGIHEGVIRYSSQYKNRLKRLALFLRATYRMIFIASVVLMMVIVVFAPKINNILFSGRNYVLLIYITAFLIPIYALQVILLAILHGFQQYKKVTVIITLLHFFSMILMVTLIWQLDMTGALLTVIMTPVIAFVIILAFIGKDFKKIFLIPLTNGKQGSQNQQYLKRLLPFVIMAGVTAFIIPLSTIAIRNIIINHFASEGQRFAGYWDAIRKVSMFYFMFIAPVFNMYYFPAISKNPSRQEWKKHAKEMLVKFYPFILAGMILIYLFRHYVTLIIFSDEYLPMNNLYGWQLSADFIRLIALLLAYKFWSQALVNQYLFAEISYWILFYVLSTVLIKSMGLAGVMKAYFLVNLYYLFIVIFIFRKDLRPSLN